MNEQLHTDAFPFESYGWKVEECNSPQSRGNPRLDRECLLVVDDEPLIRTLAKMSLSQFGYRVHAVESGEEALELIRTQPNLVDLMILDLVMPGLTGQETLALLHQEIDPPAVLLSSGYTPEALVPEHLHNVLGFLKKPYRPSHLLAAVRQCLDERNRRQILAGG